MAYPIRGIMCPTERAADAAAPRAGGGGTSGEGHAPARAWDGHAAPLTLIVGR